MCAEALECMQNAVSIFTNIGRLSMAAKHLKDMAEIYEKEDNAEDALTFYQQAADLYAGEEVNRCAVWPLCEGLLNEQLLLSFLSQQTGFSIV
jgi:tetratricopeptide (TPR) repeat protein